MLRDAVQCFVAALVSTLLIVAAALIIDDRAPRANPDRDDTRLERVVDVQLPTM